MGCNNLCGNTTIPYPFYLKPCDNTNNDFGLECYNNSTLMITLNKVSYTVTSIDPDSIIINPNRSSCDINLQKFTIDGIRSYAISNSNIIQFSDCKNLRNCTFSCSIPATGNDEQCKLVNTCCNYLENDTLWQPGYPDFTQFSQMQCKGFTSWVLSSVIPNRLENYGLKLGWALMGNCTTFRCDANALCANAIYVKGGVRSACKYGYKGDGFNEGAGCRRDLARGGKNNGVKIGSIIRGILVVPLVLVLMFIYRRRYTRKPDLPVMVPNNVSTRSFSIEELKTATHNFSQEIDKGGFGTVFYGKLLDGKEIAVKVLSSSSKQGVLEFLNEIDLLSRVNHKNLVWLLGYCNSSKELMLVYEYVGGGSLRDHFHGSLANSSALDWKARIRVALDAVEGLEYMHSRSRPKIIHRDVKSSNILLDLNMREKAVDFGLSKILQDDRISHVTTTIKGTMGYLDPDNKKLTERSDVYSFGVVLLEIICGTKSIEDAVSEEEEVNLVRWVMLHAEANKDIPSRLTNIIDNKMSLGENEMQCFNCVVNLALQCVDREGSKRPTMNEIVAGIRVVMLYIEPQDINAEKSVDALPTEGYNSADCSSSLHHAGR
ncbi:hypothetical protein SUGI_0687760 [Cryptomeria japonica]|nr:hypothetical protein SUGI_0687760 [Cryptomeria japonica]